MENEEKEIFAEDCFRLDHDTARRNSLRQNGMDVDINHLERYLTVKFSGGESQKIEALLWDFVGGEYKSYFVCPCCGKKHPWLFLLPGGKEFRCRGCHKIRYRLALTEPGPHGKTLEDMKDLDALFKLIQKLRPKVFFGDDYSTRFNKVLDKCKQIGYTRLPRYAKRNYIQKLREHFEIYKSYAINGALRGCPEMNYKKLAFGSLKTLFVLH